MTIKNPESLTPDDVLNRLAEINKRQADDAEDKKILLGMLSIFRKEGTIGDKVEHPDFTMKWTKKETWKYSAAIKSAQAMEQVEGIATKKTSEGWVTRKTKNESLF